MRIRSLALVPLCGLLAACISVGPDYQTPDPAVPPSWNAPATIGPAALAGWWRQFNDPALNALIATALEGAPDLRTAQAKLREARARSGVAAAARLPSVGNTINARRSESAGNGVAADSYSIGFDASWEIDLFGGTRRSIEAAEATAAAAEAGVHDAQVSLAAEVARSYLDLRTQQTRLVIARDNLASLVASDQLVGWRHQAGLVTELDKVQSASTLEQARARIPPLKTTLEADLNALAVLTGRPRAEIAARVAAPAAMPATPPALGISLPTETIRQRADVRSAERRLAAATANIGVATAALYPSLKLTGSIGVAALSTDSLLRPEAATSSLLAGLTTPIFEGGRLRRNIEIQSALQEQALIAYQQSVAQALAEVENALVALANTRRRLASLRSAAESAQLAEKLASYRYSAGLIDYSTLQDTQRTALSVLDAQASAQGDEASALVQLYKSLGGGFGADETASR